MPRKIRPSRSLSKKLPGIAPVAWHKDENILRRMQLVEVERLKGYSALRASANLGIPYSTVWRDYQRLDELWLARTSKAQDTLRAHAVRRFDSVIAQCASLLSQDEAYTQAVLFGMPVQVTCPGRQEHLTRDLLMKDRTGPSGGNTTYGTAFTCLEPHAMEKTIHLDDKGAAQYRRIAGQVLQAMNAAVMNQARILGLVVEKKALTDADGTDLSSALAQLLLEGEPVDVSSLPSANSEPEAESFDVGLV